MKWFQDFLEIFISDDKIDLRLRIMNELAFIGKIFQMIIYIFGGIAIGAIVLVLIFSFPEIPKQDQLLVEIVLLGFIVVLGFGYLASLFFKGLGFISKKSKEQFLSSSLWKGFINWQESVYSVVLSFGTKYILYPRLSNLEPGIDQKEQSKFTVHDSPPTPLLLNEEYCRTTISRYKEFSSRLSGLEIVLLLVGSIAMCIVWIVPVALLNTISETLAIICIFVMAGITLILIPGIIKGYFDIVYLRKNIWVQALRDIEKQHELETIAQTLGSESIIRLQNQIENMKRFYANEFLSTQDELAKKEEALKQLDILTDLSDSEKESIIWLIDQRRVDEEKVQEKKDRIHFRREIIKDVVIGLIFFLLGLWIGR